MRRFLILLEHFCHGALLGGFIGAVAGISEYFFLHLNSAFSDDIVRAYWDIVLPYTVVGILGGTLVAVGLRLVPGHSHSLSRQIARLFSTLIALVVFSYLVAWATYELMKPVLKLSNMIAYLASAAGATVIGLVLYGALRAILFRLENLVPRLRLGMPVAVVSLSAIVLLLPPVYLDRGHSLQGVPTGSPKNDGQRKRPNIVFILIDALRADHLPIYGYSRQTAPNLSALTRKGITFTRMYAQAPSTRPSVATIFSSLYPIVHKVNEDRAYFSDSITTLPEILRSAGYKTFAASANANVSPTFGYSQGFDEFKVWKTESRFRLTLMGRLAEDGLSTGVLTRLVGERAEVVPQAETITGLTLDWVSRNREGPLFLYIHYIDPHDPYSPPPPYDQAFDYRRDRLIRSGGVDPLKLIAKDKDPDRIGRVLDLYDGEILYTDHQVDRLLKGLEEMGVLDNALVIVTADHGEEFFEHGADRHGKSAYEEVLRVPFLIAWPGRIPAGSTFGPMVGLIDLMPTILDLLGIKPPPGIQGLSFAAQLANPNLPMPKRKFFAQVIQDGFSLEMVRDERYKLIRHVHGPKQGFEELHDWQQDPLERTNIAHQAKPLVASLRQELEAFNNLTRRAASLIQAEQIQGLDKDTERALRSLGYIK